MSVVVVVTAFPAPGLQGEAIAAFERVIPLVHQEAGVERYALHVGQDRLVMIDQYESEKLRAEHLKGAALAQLRTALDGKLSRALDAQMLAPHPARDARKGAL